MACVARFGKVELHTLAAQHRDLFVEVYTCPSVMSQVCAPFSTDRALRAFANTLEIQAGDTACTGLWVIRCRGEDLGLMGLQTCEFARTGELGTLLLTRAQGRGVALDAVEATIDMAFDSPYWHALLVRHHSGNHGAASVMRRVRMRVEPEIDLQSDRVYWHLPRALWPGLGDETALVSAAPDPIDPSARAAMKG